MGLDHSQVIRSISPSAGSGVPLFQNGGTIKKWPYSATVNRQHAGRRGEEREEVFAGLLAPVAGRSAARTYASIWTARCVNRQKR